MVSYCKTNNSDLQSDEDGNDASKKRRFKKIASTEPVLQHLIADLGHHREVHCTVRFSKEEEQEEEEVILVTPLTNEETNLMIKAFTNKSSTSNVVLPNPALADKLISVIKRKFKDGAVTLSLEDPGANLRMETNNVAFLNT